MTKSNDFNVERFKQLGALGELGHYVFITRDRDYLWTFCTIKDKLYLVDTICAEEGEFRIDKITYNRDGTVHLSGIYDWDGWIISTKNLQSI